MRGETYRLREWFRASPTLFDWQASRQLSPSAKGLYSYLTSGFFLGVVYRPVHPAATTPTTTTTATAVAAAACFGW